MGWLDPIPTIPNLYIGGLYALYQTDLVTEANITHVLSAIDYEPFPPGSAAHARFSHLKHYHVRLEDHPNENILKDLRRGCAFIEEGLRGGGGVFVHCAMGKSRSATFVVAYLMWRSRREGGGNMGWREALGVLCESRGVCDPNVGFKEQLGVWGRMLDAGSEEEGERVYREWLETRFLGESWEWERRKGELKASL